MKIRELHGEQADYDRVVRDLFAKGCGALIGHGPCNRPTDPVLIECNQPMAFLLWRSASLQNGRCWTFLCPQHTGSVENVMRDMSEEQRATQRDEAKKFFRTAKAVWVEPGVIECVDVSALLTRGRFDVRYPSGKQVTCSGRFVVTAEPKTGALPCVVDDARPDGSKERVLVLDPRCIVRMEGSIVYHPRGRPDVAAWVAEWLAEHPEWDA